MSDGLRLAYADPPYPGKAHLYPENTEVDHVELIAQLCEYDGWALSTDEVNLAYVLSLCPPRTRVLAWCRTTAPPLPPLPYYAWEPVLAWPARRTGVEPIRSWTATHAATGPAQRDGLTGQKPPMFCEWVIRSLGAVPGDTLDDLYPGTGIMGETFARFQGTMPVYVSDSRRSTRARHNIRTRGAETLDGSERVYRNERHAPLEA